MRAFAELCEGVARTSKKNEKLDLVAAYLRGRTLDEAALSVVFLRGRAFPEFERLPLQVGGSLLRRVVQFLTSASDEQLLAAYKRHGDLGAAAEDLWGDRGGADLSVVELERALRAVARARTAAQKQLGIEHVLATSSPRVVKYVIKILTGDLRIGLKEGLVEEAVARAFGARFEDVQRANMLLGDIGAALRLAAEGKLDTAAMRLFHPLGFMLASAAESAEDAASSLPQGIVEDKLDGIRAQAHFSRATDEVRFFSRTRDDVTLAFPELLQEIRRFDRDVVFDGEIVAYRDGALPFSELQKRLGRKTVPERLKLEVPVAFVAFDVLYDGTELLLELPLRERMTRLSQIFDARSPPRPIERVGQLDLFSQSPVRAAVLMSEPRAGGGSKESLEALFVEAQARGNEGLMIKDPESSYLPGRRGKSWLKLKRELATLDVVVVGVELGHGKRAGILSDYTFAIRDGDRLLTVGKAYSGLTDAEIAHWMKFFMEHTLEDQGFFRTVEPKLVIEVAFNAVMRSERHESGYALRFPRIVRVREDKTVDEIDTLERLRALCS